MLTPKPVTVGQKDALLRELRMISIVDQDENKLRQKLRECNGLLDELFWRNLIARVIDKSLTILTIVLVYGQTRGYGLSDGGDPNNPRLEFSLYSVISYIGKHRGILWTFAPFIEQAFATTPTRRALFWRRLAHEEQLIYQEFEHAYSQYSLLQQRLSARGISFQMQADYHRQSGDLLRTAIVEPEQAVPMADRQVNYVSNLGAQNHKWQVFYVEKVLNHYLSGLAACCSGLQMKKRPSESMGDLLALQWTSKTLLQRAGQLMSQQGALIQPALANQVSIYTQPVQQALDDCAQPRSASSSDEDAHTGMSYYGDDTDSEDSMTHLLPTTQQVGLFHRRRQQETPSNDDFDSSENLNKQHTHGT